MANEKPENDINTMAEVDPEPENKSNEQGHEWAFVSTVRTRGAGKRWGGGGGGEEFCPSNSVYACVYVLYLRLTPMYQK